MATDKVSRTISVTRHMFDEVERYRQYRQEQERGFTMSWNAAVRVLIAEGLRRLSPKPTRRRSS